jgi:NAD(P)H-hydrate epimerase
VQQLQQRYGGVIVLKGAGTLIYDGKLPIRLCTAGNPGMASGGMGDALTGVIGGLLAQRLSLIDAACLGVLLHAMAADKAAEKEGERGMLAMDLMPHLRHLVNLHY